MRLGMATTVGVLLAAQGHALAQTIAAGATGGGTAPVGATCLSRPFVDANGVTQPHTIYVPAGEASAYRAKGFTPAACGAVSVEVHRARMCRMALYGNDAVQKRFEQVLGAKPKELCESAKRVTPFPAAAN